MLRFAIKLRGLVLKPMPRFVSSFLAHFALRLGQSKKPRAFTFFVLALTVIGLFQNCSQPYQIERTPSTKLSQSSLPVPSIQYSVNPAVYVVNSTIIKNHLVLGELSPSAEVSFAIISSLPKGLDFNPLDGSISGTPLELFPASVFVVSVLSTKTKEVLASTRLSLEVGPPPIDAPANLSYSSPNSQYWAKVAITPNRVGSSGGGITSFSISPGLPQGLVLNSASGIISGTPTTQQGAKNYSVTGTNASGNSTTTISIAVGAASLTYATNPISYVLGTAMQKNSAILLPGGLSDVIFLVSPALPTGLNLNAQDGSISGNPIAATNRRSYTITAMMANSALAQTNLDLVVESQPLLGPTNLTYSKNPAVYHVNQPIEENKPTLQGAAVTNYLIQPALPQGLVFNAQTGIISGIPVAPLATTDFDITAINTSGRTQTKLQIQVLDLGQAFTFTWKTDQANESMTLPLVFGYSYDFVVDWGDGSQDRITSATSEKKTHQFGQAKTYTLSLTGQVEAWNNVSGTCKIQQVLELGKVGWKNLNSAFSYCQSLTAINGGETSQVTDMGYMFNGATSANPDVSKWDISKVTSMYGMFYDATSANPDVSKWDTSKVTDMGAIFSGATLANPNISKWSVQSFYTNSYREGLTYFLGNAKILPTQVYSAFLIKAAQDLKVLSTPPTKIRADMGKSKYSAEAKPARQYLVDTLHWEINDGGQ